MSKPINEKDLYKYCPHCASNLVLQTIDSEKIKKCNKCSFTFWNNPKPVVSILISRNSEVLLLRRAKKPFRGHWCMPGGFIKWEEAPREALIRETKEEIGLIPSIGNIIGAYQIDNDPRGMHLDIIYEGSIDGNINLSSEHDVYDYFDPNKLPVKVEYKHPEAINDWHKKLIHRNK